MAAFSAKGWKRLIIPDCGGREGCLCRQCETARHNTAQRQHERAYFRKHKTRMILG